MTEFSSHRSCRTWQNNSRRCYEISWRSKSEPWFETSIDHRVEIQGCCPVRIFKRRIHQRDDGHRVWSASLSQNLIFFADLLIFFCEFITYRADSIDKLKMKLRVLETQLRDSSNFKDFYHFTFNYAKNPSQKGLDLDMAITYWNIVMEGRFKFLHLWCKFLEVSCYCLGTFNSRIVILNLVFLISLGMYFSGSLRTRNKIFILFYRNPLINNVFYKDYRKL